MDKAQKGLISSYYHARGIAIQGSHHQYQPYEYSKYGLDSGIMNIKDLPIGEKHDIFEKNTMVRKYVAPYIDAYNKNSKGFLRLLINYENTGDPQHLYKFIQGSNFMTEAGANAEINHNYIDLNTEKNTILAAVDVRDDYDSITYSVTNNNYGYGYDADEAEYMHGGLNTQNINMIKKIATRLGFTKENLKGFDNNEGAIKEFLEKYDMEEIVSTYNSEYGNARDDAESMVAQEQLDKFPIDIDNAQLYIPKVLKFLYDNDLNDVKSFDDFLTRVEDNSQLNAEVVNQAGYEEMNLDELDRTISSELETIWDNLNDPENKYYGRAEAVREVEAAVKKFGFKTSSQHYIIATRDQRDKVINILDYGYAADSDILQLKIQLDYKGVEKKRTGWIPYKKLGDYIDQQELPRLREELNQIIKTEIKNFRNE